MTERVLILDFGAQYTQLIARRLREQHVYCEIHPCTVGSSFVRQFEPAAVILSGGPASTTEEASPRAPHSVFELGVPVLGICYGEQTMCAQLGGKVESGHHREFGRALITLDRPSPLFDGLLEPGDQAPVWMSHGDRVTALPPGFVTIAHSEGAPFAAIADDERRFYGVQFHPEVIHTAIGAGLLRNFLYRVASLARRLVDASLPRGGDPPRPPAGRERRRDLRPLRRRRFRRHRAPHPRGHRRPAHLRLRRHRPPALRRGHRGGRPLPRPLQHPPHPRPRFRPLPRQARTASPTPSESAS